MRRAAAVGAGAAVLMAALWIAVSALRHYGVLAETPFGRIDAGIFTPLKLIAAALLGSEALKAEGSSAAVGLLLHMTVGAALACVFAAITPRTRSVPVALGYGIGFGVLVFLCAATFVLPALDRVLLRNVNIGWFLIYHAAYGAALAMLVPEPTGSAVYVVHPQHCTASCATDRVPSCRHGAVASARGSRCVAASTAQPMIPAMNEPSRTPSFACFRSSGAS
jgi:hypothetical protein